MLAPLSRPLNLAALGWSPSTPREECKGAVVVVADVEPEVLRSRGAELRGKIVFLDTPKINADGYGKVMPKIEAAWPAFQKGGRVGGDDCRIARRTMSLNAHGAGGVRSCFRCLELKLGMEDAKLIQRELERGPVTLQMTAGE
jgi:hypothetical protein